MTPLLSLIVFGKAAPAGSKRAFIPKGWKRAVLSDANPRSKPWKMLVAREAAIAWAGKPLLREALEAHWTFYQPRPKSHFNRKGLKPDAPPYPIGPPDALKLVRGPEDSLTGVIYVDDRLIVSHRIWKLYGEPARVEIEVFRATQSIDILPKTLDKQFTLG